MNSEIQEQMLNYISAPIEVIVKNWNYRKMNNYFNTFYKKKPIII